VQVKSSLLDFLGLLLYGNLTNSRLESRESATSSENTKVIRKSILIAAMFKQPIPI
jgi:hypothetical protein